MAQLFQLKKSEAMSRLQEDAVVHPGLCVVSGFLSCAIQNRKEIHLLGPPAECKVPRRNSMDARCQSLEHPEI